MTTEYVVNVFKKQPLRADLEKFLNEYQSYKHDVKAHYDTDIKQVVYTVISTRTKL